jgi:hypothetical protein
MRNNVKIDFKNIRSLINVGQNLGHNLDDRERKILNDFGPIGRVVALRNIQSEIEENSRCGSIFFLKRSIDNVFFLKKKLWPRGQLSYNVL